VVREELRNFYALPNIIRGIKSRTMRWTRHVACMGETEKYKNILVGKPEGKRLFGRTRRRWEDLREIGWEGVVWMHLAQDREQ